MLNSFLFERSLANTIPSCVFDLDATIKRSWDGSSQGITNLCNAPATGEAHTYYDFWRGSGSGSGSDDPTLGGTAATPSASLNLDGTQKITHKAGAGPTAFLANAQREDVADPWSILMAFHYVASGSVTQALCGTTNANATRGFRLVVSTAGVLSLVRANGSTSNTKATGLTLVDGTDYLLGFTFQNDTLAYKASISGTTFSDSGSALTLATNNAASTGLFAVCTANTSATINLVNGSKLYGVSMFNTILSDANYAAAKTVYNARHNRTYP